MSLPLAFGTDLATIPWPGPYLHADPERVRQWHDSAGTVGQAARIGLAWSGNPAHKNDHNRSIAYAQLAPLLAAAGRAASSSRCKRNTAPAKRALLAASPVRDLSRPTCAISATPPPCAPRWIW